jgi:Putative peptidoglycan binding domain
MKKIISSSLIFAFATIWINAQTINQIPFIGQRGENVRVIQNQLTQKGFSLGTIDGQFGGETMSALKSFQSKNTLKSHGMVDLPTLEKLGITFSPIANAKGYMPLSWESASDTNKVWSDYTFQIIEGLFADFDKCQDITRIRPDYKILSRTQKINVWGELISAIAKPESSWNPTSWMFEAQGICGDGTTSQKRRTSTIILSRQKKLQRTSLQI